MEYTATVTKRTNVAFKFKEGTDVEALAKEFSETIFEVNVEEMMEFIAKQITLGYSFIEGIGQISYNSDLSFTYADEDTVLVYDVEIEDFEVEV